MAAPVRHTANSIPGSSDISYWRAAIHRSCPINATPVNSRAGIITIRRVGIGICRIPVCRIGVPGVIISRTIVGIVGIAIVTSGS